MKYIKSVDNLYPALVECFGIILLGYIAGKFNFINSVEAKGKEIFRVAKMYGLYGLYGLIFFNPKIVRIVRIVRICFQIVRIVRIFILENTPFF